MSEGRNGKRASRKTCEKIAKTENSNPDLNGKEIADKSGFSKSTVYFCHSEFPELFKPIKDNKVKKTTEGNYTELESEGQIKTLDGLLEEAEVDRETWKVDWYDINKWPTTIKGPGDEPITVENWKVEAKLIKKNPEPIEFEPVKPVSINHSYSDPGKPKETDLDRAVLIPDVHIGYRKNNFTRELENFHDRRGLDLAIQLINHVNPQLVVLLGDFLDMPDWSKNYVHSEEFAQNTQPALDEGVWWLNEIRETAPDAKIVYIQGNHEARVRDFLMKNNKAACGLKKATATEEEPDILSVPNILDLESLGIEWVGGYPDEEYWPTDNLKLYHGDNISSVIGKTAKTNIEDSTVNRAFAHCHRFEKVSKTIYKNNNKKTIQSVSLGTLAKVGGRTPGTKEKQNWQNALGIASFDKNKVNIDGIAIKDGWMTYGGKDFYGEDRLKEIKNDAKLSKYQFC